MCCLQHVVVLVQNLKKPSRHYSQVKNVSKTNNEIYVLYFRIILQNFSSFRYS